MRVVARLVTAVGDPVPSVELRKEEKIDDDDLEAKENHVESCLAIVPCSIRGQSSCGPGRPSTEACNENGEEDCHSQDDQL